MFKRNRTNILNKLIDEVPNNYFLSRENNMARFKLGNAYFEIYSNNIERISNTDRIVNVILKHGFSVTFFKTEKMILFSGEQNV